MKAIIRLAAVVLAVFALQSCNYNSLVEAHVYGFEKYEIAERLGVSRAAVTYRLLGAEDRLIKNFLKKF